MELKQAHKLQHGESIQVLDRTSEKKVHYLTATFLFLDKYSIARVLIGEEECSRYVHEILQVPHLKNTTTLHMAGIKRDEYDN